MQQSTLLSVFLSVLLVSITQAKAEDLLSAPNETSVAETIGTSVARDEGAASSRPHAKDSAEESVPQLQEVIVSAQKRTQDLQVVPISVQVVGSQAIAEGNHNSLEELSEILPAVHVGNGDKLSNDLFIRGIGSGENQGFEQSVAIFSDDIYHGRSRMSGATFLDLDRIEVLKGPQSTFFGNNAIAGALNLVSRKPGGSLDASTRALYGQFGQYDWEGALGGPITDWFGARLAVTRNGDQGWVKNVNTGRWNPAQNNEAARLMFTFHPNEEFDATLKVEGSRTRTSGGGGGGVNQWNRCPPPTPFDANTAAFGGGGASCAVAISLGVPIDVTQDRVSALGGQFNSLSTFENVLTINYRRWDLDFTSVSGFYNYHFNANDAPSQLPVPWITTVFPERYHQFSQEFRITSPANRPIEYIAGVYYHTDRFDSRFNANIPLLNAVINAVPPFAPFIPYLPLAESATFFQDEHTFSAFASATWNVTDRLRFNAGLRGSWVKRTDGGDKEYGTGTEVYGGFVPMPAALQSIIGPLIFGPPGASQPLSRSDRAWMPSVGVQYQVQPQAMIYFSYVKGFKAGGFNATDVISAQENIEFGPERVNAYELGIKSKWLEGRALVNADVFFSDYKGLQVDANFPSGPPLNTTISGIRNAAASRSKGVELETQWLPSAGLRLGANITYLKSYYVSYPNAPASALFPTASGDMDLSGRPTSYAPRWSGGLLVQQTFSLAGGYKFSTSLLPYFSTKYNKDPQLEAIGLGYLSGTGGYLRLDARLSLESPDGHWGIDVIGKNLTDRTIYTSTYTSGVVTREQPRNVAGQVRFTW